MLTIRSSQVVNAPVNNDDPFQPGNARDSQTISLPSGGATQSVPC